MVHHNEELENKLALVPSGFRDDEMQAHAQNVVCQEEKLQCEQCLDFSFLLVCFGIKECKKFLMEKFLHRLPVTFS